MTTPAPDISSMLDELHRRTRTAQERFEAEHELLVKVVKERNELRAERTRLREALRDTREWLNTPRQYRSSTLELLHKIDAALGDQKG